MFFSFMFYIFIYFFSLFVKCVFSRDYGRYNYITFACFDWICEFVNPTISLAISSDFLLSGNDNSIMCALAKKKAVRHYIDLIVKVFKVLNFFVDVINEWPLNQTIFCSLLLHSYFYLKSNRLQMFYKIGVLRNFAKFTEKQLCWSLFFKKVAGLLSASSLLFSFCSLFCMLGKKDHHNFIKKEEQIWK